MSVALLDVNVLVSLLDVGHVSHRASASWFAGDTEGWATCPITENGFVRIVSGRTYPGTLTVSGARDRLAEACASKAHQFWACDTSVLDRARIDASRLHGQKQVTDAYLLSLAVARGGRLVTLDRSVATSAVVGATADHLVVL